MERLEKYEKEPSACCEKGWTRGVESWFCKGCGRRDMRFWRRIFGGEIVRLSEYWESEVEEEIMRAFKLKDVGEMMGWKRIGVVRGE